MSIILSVKKKKVRKSGHGGKISVRLHSVHSVQAIAQKLKSVRVAGLLQVTHVIHDIFVSKLVHKIYCFLSVMLGYLPNSALWYKS